MATPPQQPPILDTAKRRQKGIDDSRYAPHNAARWSRAERAQFSSCNHHAATGMNTKHDINASRYAPHNFHKPENASFRASSFYPNSQSQRPYTPPPKPRTFRNLPYKVQFRVLTAVQTLLEESCYAFAEKWLPHILIQKGWTCSEAVEMAKWKTVLSGPLPAGSLKPGNYSIIQRLGEAVKLRNITAHREHCDNDKIRKMIGKARGLVEVLEIGEVVGETVGKLERLRDEVNEWESGDGGEEERDPRRRLHDVLQDIGTEEVVDFDEMDWVPGSGSGSDNEGVGETVGEEMDWE